MADCSTLSFLKLLLIGALSQQQDRVTNTKPSGPVLRADRCWSGLRQQNSHSYSPSGGMNAIAEAGSYGAKPCFASMETFLGSCPPGPSPFLGRLKLVLVEQQVWASCSGQAGWEGVFAPLQRPLFKVGAYIPWAFILDHHVGKK